MFRNSQSSERGSLLIQLIIACAIIGILSSIAYGQYEGAKMKARDTQRVSDVQTLAIALKQYRERTGTYNTAGGPSGNGEGWVSESGGGTDSITKILEDAGLLNSEVMNDPTRGTQGYVIRLCNGGLEFAVYARKERISSAEQTSFNSSTLCDRAQVMAGQFQMNYGIGG